MNNLMFIYVTSYCVIGPEPVEYCNKTDTSNNGEQTHTVIDSMCDFMINCKS